MLININVSERQMREKEGMREGFAPLREEG
jgi:hypothetical protein